MYWRVRGPSTLIRGWGMEFGYDDAGLRYHDD